MEGGVEENPSRSGRLKDVGTAIGKGKACEGEKGKAREIIQRENPGRMQVKENRGVPLGGCPPRRRSLGAANLKERTGMHPPRFGKRKTQEGGGGTVARDVCEHDVRAGMATATSGQAKIWTRDSRREG